MYAVVQGNYAAARTGPEACTLDFDEVTDALHAIPGRLDGYWVIKALSDGQVVPIYTAHEWIAELT